MSAVPFLLVAALAQQASLTAGMPAATSPPPAVQAMRLSAPITVDGDLSDPAWRDARQITGFVQRDPDEGLPATQRTVVTIAFDDEAIYIAARMYDTAPDSIVARLGRRDRGTSSDAFVFFVDPYLDRRTGFYFGINAAGTLYDGVLFNDDWDDDTWDGVWTGKARIDAEGWTAEMRIPYSQLRFRSGARQVWGVNFKREIARNNERDYVVVTPKSASGFVSRFVPLQGLDGIRPPARIELLPYVTSRAEFTNHAKGDPFDDGSKLGGDVGLDFKLGLGPNLTLDGTVNPDFGQVEVDPAVVNLSDVETFFQEKRPFFIEGSSIFNFGQGGANNFWGFGFGSPDFFYSRRIGRAPQGGVRDPADYVSSPSGTSILGAAKLSGKLAGSWNVGMLHALTAKESAQLDLGGIRSEAEVEPLTYYGVYRGQKEFQNGHRAIGFLSTVAARRFDDERLRDDVNSSAYGLGVDGWTFLDADREWVVTGWAGLTHVRGSQARIFALQQNSQHYFQRPDADRFRLDSAATALTGYAGRVFVNKQKGNWTFNSAFGFVTPSFDVNDVGLQFRSDAINTHVVTGYRWTTPGRIARRVQTNVALHRTWDFDGNTTWTGLFSNGWATWKNYWGSGYWFSFNPETVNNRRTRGGPLTLNPTSIEGGGWIESDDRKAVTFGMDGNYSRGAQESQESWNVNLSVSWRPSTSLTLRAGPSFERSQTGAQYLTAVDDPTATATFGRRYVFGDLQQTTFAASIRLNWIFTPKLSLEVFAQPLIASGDYRAFKELAAPRTYDFGVYGEGARTVTTDSTGFVLDPDGAGPAAAFGIGQPNFNFKSLRGNAVLRWEYLPGSTLFLVWTQTRSDFENVGQFRFGRSLGRLLDATPDNIFAIKISYWWNP